MYLCCCCHSCAFASGKQMSNSYHRNAYQTDEYSIGEKKENDFSAFQQCSAIFLLSLHCCNVSTPETCMLSMSVYKRNLQLFFSNIMHSFNYLKEERQSQKNKMKKKDFQIYICICINSRANI